MQPRSQAHGARTARTDPTERRKDSSRFPLNPSQTSEIPLAYDLPPLPYDYEALQPYMSRETL